MKFYVKISSQNFFIFFYVEIHSESTFEPANATVG